MKTIAIIAALLALTGCATTAPSTDHSRFCQSVHDRADQSTRALEPMLDDCLAGRRCPTAGQLDVVTQRIEASTTCVQSGYYPTHVRTSIARLDRIVAKVDAVVKKHGM